MGRTVTASFSHCSPVFTRPEFIQLMPSVMSGSLTLWCLNWFLFMILGNFSNLQWISVKTYKLWVATPVKSRLVGLAIEYWQTKYEGFCSKVMVLIHVHFGKLLWISGKNMLWSKPLQAFTPSSPSIISLRLQLIYRFWKLEHIINPQINKLLTFFYISRTNYITYLCI